MPARPDTFAEIASFYDPIMEHVDYDRWFATVSELAPLLPPHFRYLDAACGTGTLLDAFGRAGWRCFGADLSPGMLRAGRKAGRPIPFFAADLRALPLHNSMDLITCLFDSMNFLLSLEDITQCLRSFHDALTENGLLYFDVVTERMVREHFEDQSWEEDNGRFVTTWENWYDRRERLITTEVRVNTGAACLLEERIYDQGEIEGAVREAGFTLLGVYDAKTWGKPKRKTVRLDFLAIKGGEARYRKTFPKARKRVRTWLGQQVD